MRIDFRALFGTATFASNSVMVVNASYIISAEAYYKLFFHAAKHPHRSVNGVLLGKQNPPSPGGTVTILDAVPLLHHWTSLSPMMEIGLDLVRSPVCQL